MSQQDSKQRTFYGTSRRDGKCGCCVAAIPRGSSAWWSHRSGWLCTGCQANPTAFSIPVPVYQCKLVREGTVNASERLSCTDIAGEVAARLTKDSPVELLIALLLDTKQQLIGASVISTGTLNASLVHPREFFRPAILANAAGVIMAHNHPSGDLTPSAEDWTVFEILKKAGDIVGIRVLDSIIVNADAKFLSMASAKS